MELSHKMGTNPLSAIKRVMILLGAVLAFGTMHGRQLTQAEAQGIARSVVKKSVSLATASKGMHAPGEAASGVYVFNADDGKGFAVIAADDRIAPVLAYSDEGALDFSNAAPGAKWLIEEYARIIAALAAAEGAPAARAAASTRAAASDMSAIEPLVATKWAQGEPYNAMCPEISGMKTLTGCVATAIGQYINYMQAGEAANGVDAYVTRTSGISMPALAPRSWDWANMDDAEIASLMLYCGQAVHMDYGVYESGAYMEEVSGALNGVFGLEPEYRLLSRSAYGDHQWDDMLHSELEAGRPLIYSAIAQGGGAHCFIIDGYADGLFHVNWGWGGAADGYFSFYPLDGDSSADYIYNQSIVTIRDDEPGESNPDFGVTIDGVNFSLRVNAEGEHIATVIPLKGGAKYSGEVILPGHITWEGADYTVKEIGSGAFAGCIDMTSIYLPATIERQAWSVFDGCENLKKVDVEDIAAFIRIDVGGYFVGSPLWYGADLYEKGKKVVDLVVPEGIEIIDYVKFANCPSIETVALPLSLRKLGQYAFLGCENLNKVMIAEPSVTWVDFGAFENCTSLKEITLPSSVGKISSRAFYGCYNLKKIKCMSEDVPLETDENIADFRVLSEAYLYVSDEALERYKKEEHLGWFENILPLSQEKPISRTETFSLGDFDYEINLDEMTAMVTACKNNRNPVVPSSVSYNGNEYKVKTIGFEAFYGIGNEAADETFEIIVSPGVEHLGFRSFSWCSYDELSLPNTIKRVGHRAFFLDIGTPSQKKRLELPETVESIGREALYNVEIGELYVYNMDPPAIEYDTFIEEQYDQLEVFIPAGSKKKYVSHPIWSKFTHLNVIGGEDESGDYDVALSAEIKGTKEIKNGVMPLVVVGSFRNNGLQPIDKLILKWSIDGENVKGEKEFTVNLQPNHQYSFEESIRMPALASSGSHNITLEASIVGAEDKDMSDNAASLAFETFDKGFHRVSLVEEFTSESCPFSRSRLPIIGQGIHSSGYDDFAAVVTHHCGFYPDFLTLTEDYVWLYGGNGSYTPAWSLNRTILEENSPVMNVDGVIKVNKYLTSAQSSLCNAAIRVKWEQEGNKIVVKAAVEKEDGFDVNAGYEYLTIFLLEDSIPSTTDPENYIFNDVPRHLFTDTWGDDVRWKENVCGYRYSVPLSDEWNKDNLKVVAFLHKYDSEDRSECQVYTAGSSALPQYGNDFDDSIYEEYIPRKEQTITWENNETYVQVNDTIKLKAIASSGLPVTYVLESGDAELNGDELLPKSIGTVTVKAKQDGNEEYSRAKSVSFSFEVGKRTQSIEWENDFSNVFVNDTIELHVGATSGLPVSISVESGEAVIEDNTLIAKAEGDVILKVVQEGNEIFYEAESYNGVYIRKREQNIEWSNDFESVFVNDSIELHAEASSGLPVSFVVESGDAVIEDNIFVALGEGEVMLKAVQEGNEEFSQVESIYSFNIFKRGQVIHWRSDFGLVFVNDSIELHAEASSGLPVTFSVEFGDAVIEDNIFVALGEGEVVLKAVQEGNKEFYAFESVIGFGIIKREQNIEWSNDFESVFVNDSIELHAEASSGLPVSFVVESGDAVIEDNIFVALGEGQVVLKAVQEGNEEYRSIDAVRFIWVNKKSQTITWEEESYELYVNQTIQLHAESSSGLPVTYVLDSSNAIAILDGDMLTAKGAGLCVVRAVNEGNEEYEPAGEASITFYISKREQTITWEEDSYDLHVNETIELHASASSGLPISYEIESGNATLDGDMLTSHSNGAIAVRAKQDGNEEYSEVSLTRFFYSGLSSQTIIWEEESYDLHVNETIQLHASASSGLPITYEIQSGNATLDGDMLTAHSEGAIAVRAKQDGNGEYGSIYETRTFFASKKSQSITWEYVPSGLFVNETIQLHAESSSGLPVTYVLDSSNAIATLDGDMLTAKGEGLCVVRALNEGNEEYEPAGEASITFYISKREQTITWEEDSYDLHVNETIELHVSASSGLPISYEIESGNATLDGDMLTAHSEGAIVVSAKQDGNDEYGGAYITRTFFASKKSQSITWEEASYNIEVETTVRLNAEASSGLPVAYAIEFGWAELNGNELTPKEEGEIRVTAEQDGNYEYGAAMPVTRSFNSLSALDYIFADESGELVIYNMNGVRIYVELRYLQPGFYIINGKKIQIK